MKSILSFSTLILISLTATAPNAMAASSIATNQPSDSSKRSLSISNSTEEYQIAFWGKVIPKVLPPAIRGPVKTIINEAERAKREKERQERREKAKQERLKRIQAYQEKRAARLAAAEQKRQRERDYFNSLSPSEQKAFLEKKRAERAAVLKFWLTAFSLANSSGSFSGGSSSGGSDYEFYSTSGSRPASQAAPRRTPPIGSLYGTGPGGSFYGN